MDLLPAFTKSSILNMELEHEFYLVSIEFTISLLSQLS
jgi:hypothetical protein